MLEDSYPNCRFYIEIDDTMEAVFTEVSGLQVEMEVMEYAEGGNNTFIHKLPGRTKIANITLKRGLTKSNQFFKWLTDASLGIIKLRNVSVVLYDSGGAALTRWDFVNAYPVKWIGPQMTANGTAISVETLELAHSGLQLQ